MAKSKLPQPSSGKHSFPNLSSLWKRGKTEENSPAWKRLHRRFPLKEILKATNNFDPARKILAYKFGNENRWFSVYQGYIDDTCKFPVRIMRYKPESDRQRFLREMELLSNLHHPNIISLIGYCLDGSDRIIVLKHMANGNLHDNLHNKTDHKSPLPWKRRLEICIGAALGLERLHTGNPLIIHRDINSNHILLDKNWVANIWNFEVSTLMPPSSLESDSEHVSAGIAGSLGYMDPECLQSGQQTTKSDVFSFGVVLFEVLTGREPLDCSLPGGWGYLIDWGRRCAEDGKLGEIIDPRMKDEIAPECLKAYADLAYNCTNDRGNERPRMSDVVKRLELVLLLHECIEADIPYSPSWLRSIVPPPRSKPFFNVEDSQLSASDSDFEEVAG